MCLIGINSYEELGGRALQKPGKVSYLFRLVCVCPVKNINVHTCILNETRRCVQTNVLFQIIFRFWLEFLLSSKIWVVSQLPFHYYSYTQFFDMWNRVRL